MDKNKIWLVVVGLAIGGYFFASNAATEDKTKRDETGQIQQSGDLGSMQLKLGDCFNDFPTFTGELQEIEKVTGVPCSGSHHWELYASVDSTLTTFDLNSIQNEGKLFCESESSLSFLKGLSETRQNQIGELYGDDQTSMTYLFPMNQESFDYSKRIDCILGSNEKYYTGSIRE